VSIVVDASLALSWCFEDERSDDRIAVGHRILIEGATVPELFHVEMANGLLIAERRGRITASLVRQRLQAIAAMPIVRDNETADAAWQSTLSLARAEHLTVYDASYLELALRLGAELATLDDALARAARRRGLTVIP
jgi:predicted nucleic acid-binding protein